MSKVTKPVVLDETAKQVVAQIQLQNEILTSLASGINYKPTSIKDVLNVVCMVCIRNLNIRHGLRKISRFRCVILHVFLLSGLEDVVKHVCLLYIIVLALPGKGLDAHNVAIGIVQSDLADFFSSKFTLCKGTFVSAGRVVREEEP